MTAPARPAGRARRRPISQRRPLRVALAIFDVPMLRLGFQAAIDAAADMAVIAEIDDRATLLERLVGLEVDVVITEMAPLTGGRVTTEAIEAVRSTVPEARVIALAGGAGSEQYSLALRAGADGFLTREADPADVVTAIRCVHRGETYVSPALVTRMVNTYVLHRAGSGTVEDAYDALSDREREVLLLAATGHTNREIAKLFHLSEQTIHNYRATVMEKLGFHDRVELLKYAIRRGVINVADL